MGEEIILLRTISCWGFFSFFLLLVNISVSYMNFQPVYDDSGTSLVFRKKKKDFIFAFVEHSTPFQTNI